MNFVSDAVIAGRRLRALTVVDAFTREALAIDVDQGILGEQVVAAMARNALVRGAPKITRVNNVLCWEAAAGFGQQIFTRRQPSARYAFGARWLPPSNGIAPCHSKHWIQRRRGGRVPYRP